MRKALMLIVFITILYPGTHKTAAGIVYRDGGVHDIDSNINDKVDVYDSLSGDFTTLNIVSGGTIQDVLNARDNSKIYLFPGGRVENSLYARDNSYINVSDGYIVEMLGYHNSQTFISGGFIETGVWTYDYSQAFISGGSIPSVLYAKDNSHITVSGGSIGYWLRVDDNSQIIIYGSSFNYPFGEISVSSGTLTGILDSGETINNDFYIYDNASIILIPEPATILMVGLGGLVVFRKHKKNNHR